MSSCTQMGWSNVVALLGLFAMLGFVAWLVIRHLASTEPARQADAYPIPRRAQWPWPTQQEREDRIEAAAKKVMASRATPPRSPE